MRMVPVWIDTNPRKSWFSVYSYMLCPENERLRECIFSYLYCKYISSHSIRYKDDIDRYDKLQLMKDFVYSIKYGDILYELKEREKNVYISGVIMRLMCTMHNEGLEVGINKTLSNFIKIFPSVIVQDEDYKINFSWSEALKYIKNSYDVFHLCAAYSHFQYISLGTDVQLKRQLQKLASLSGRYFELGSTWVKNLRGTKTVSTIINRDTAFCIDGYDKCLLAVGKYDLGYTGSGIESLIKGYSYKDRSTRMLPDINQDNK